MPDAPDSPAARYASLLQRFGSGWEKGNADRIADLFTPGGVLVTSPFDPPLAGQDAIRAYWRDAPMEQSEVTFRIGEIFVAGPWFATEFKCTFRRRRTGHKVVVRGALFCETAGELLAEMRMYWDRTVDRLPA